MTKRSSNLSNVSRITRALGALGLMLALGCGDAETNVAPTASSATSSTATAATTSATTTEPTSERAPAPASAALPTAVVARAEVPSSTLTAPTRPRAADAGPELASADGVTLRRFSLTRRIEDREPVAPSARFTASSERLYAFVEAASTADEERELVVSFFGPGSRHTGVVTLTIPADAPRWRTWAYTAHANEPGAWTAEVRTKDGALVGRQRFVIE